jgi:hypothetical protein
MLADAFPERAHPDPQPWRRAAIVAGVALLHLLFIFVLLEAANVKIVPQIVKREPITIWLPPPKPKLEPQKKKQEKEQQEIDASKPLHTAPITVPPPSNAPPTDKDGLGRFGRYLKNCSAADYDKLTPQEWANCLGGAATQDNTVKFGNITTPWERQHPQPFINPKEAHGFGGCAHDDPRRLKGMDCFQMSGQKPSTSNGQQ